MNEKELKPLWSELFNGVDIIPLTHMNFNEQINALTRLFLVIFAIMVLLEFKYSLMFLVLSILFIIILYNLESNKIKRKENMQKENFETLYSQGKEHVGFRNSNKQLGYANIDINTGQRVLYVNDYTKVGANSDSYVSKNFMLSRGQNPITKIPPIIVPKSHDMSYWRANNNVVNSHVNEISNIDNYASGYAVSTCCDVPVETRPHIYRENYIQAPTVMEPLPMVPSLERVERVENYIQAPTVMEPLPMVPSLERVGNINKSNAAEALQQRISKENYTRENYGNINPNETGWVNTAAGYNLRQTEVNLPANLPVGSCPQNPNFADYNRNLFTNTLQPGVFSTNDVIEPISSNIGISFQQQFEPRTMKMNNDGSVDFHEYDPRRIKVVRTQVDMNTLPPTESTVYDPRFSGYGTSYRSYTHDLTGQTRYAYDDVDAQRMPNYIVRSKVDFIPQADRYGPMKMGMENGQSLSGMRGVANDQWTADSLSFRNDMMESLMRKRNGEMWQKRVAPTYN